MQAASDFFRNLLILGAYSLSLLLPISNINPQQGENFPNQLISAAETVPGWEFPQGSFILAKRDFLECRGKAFKDEPPPTTNFKQTFNGVSYNSLGKLNNAIVDSIKQVDISEQAKLKQALTVFKTMEQKSPDFWPVIFNLGRISYILNQYQASYTYFKRASQAMPNYAGVYFHLARAADQLNLDTAVKYNYKKALELNPNKLRPIVGMGNYYLRRNSIHNASLSFNKLQTLNPVSIPALLGKVRILIRQKKHNEARRLILEFQYDFKDTINKDPNTKTSLLYYLAELHYVLRDYSRAIKSWQEILKTPNADLYLQIARHSIQKRIRKSELYLK